MAKEETKFWVPDQNIDPYVQITRDMLHETPSVADASANLKNALDQDPQALIGRYALVELEMNHRVADDQLGPRLPRGTLMKRTVTTVSVRTAGSIAFLRRGGTITLILAPEDPEVDALILPETVVLAWHEDGDETTAVVVAIPREQMPAFAQLYASATAIVAH